MIAHDPASVTTIAAEIERTRARISRSLAHLDRDYGLRHLFVSAERMVAGADIDTGELNKIVRRNGIPLAFVAIGVGWLVCGDRDSIGMIARLSTILVPLRNLAHDWAFC